MPDDHSKVVPLLPIPNRTVKRLSADDSADSRVKVGHRQALIASSPCVFRYRGFWLCKRALFRRFVPKIFLGNCGKRVLEYEALLISAGFKVVIESDLLVVH
jgi:hypothetical protein